MKKLTGPSYWAPPYRWRSPCRRSRRRKTVIKFSHVVAPDTPKGKGSLKFQGAGREVHQRARSRLRSIRTRSSTRTMRKLQALQLGAVQMLAPSLAKFGPPRRQGVRGVRPPLQSFPTRRRFVRSPMARSARS